MGERQKIIIDTDPGIDDALAIHYACADPRIALIGLTTIFGNVLIGQATRNALYLGEQAHYDFDVAEGAAAPRVQPPNPPAYFVHGDEGFGDLPAPSPNAARKKDRRPAPSYLSELCRAYPGEITLCLIGPLTNIAALLDRDPEITALVKKVVIMGGSVWAEGNATPYAEANMWNDPHAADRVLGADWEVALIGLDVTPRITCADADFTTLAERAPIIGGFLQRIVEFYMRFFERTLHRRVCQMHDPAAVIAATDPALFAYKDAPLRVIANGERAGQTVIDKTGKRRPVRIAVDADIEQVKQKFLDIVSHADEMRAVRMK